MISNNNDYFLFCFIKARNIISIRIPKVDYESISLLVCQRFCPSTLDKTDWWYQKYMFSILPILIWKPIRSSKKLWNHAVFWSGGILLDLAFFNQTKNIKKLYIKKIVVNKRTFPVLISMKECDGCYVLFLFSRVQRISMHQFLEFVVKGRCQCQSRSHFISLWP